MEIISVDGWYLLLRWTHLLAGITGSACYIILILYRGNGLKKLTVLQKPQRCKNLCLALYGGLDGAPCILSLQEL